MKTPCITIYHRAQGKDHLICNKESCAFRARSATGQEITRSRVCVCVCDREVEERGRKGDTIQRSEFWFLLLKRVLIQILKHILYVYIVHVIFVVFCYITHTIYILLCNNIYIYNTEVMHIHYGKLGHIKGIIPRAF